MRLRDEKPLELGARGRLAPCLGLVCDGDAHHDDEDGRRGDHDHTEGDTARRVRLVHRHQRDEERRQADRQPRDPPPSTVGHGDERDGQDEHPVEVAVAAPHHDECDAESDDAGAPRVEQPPADRRLHRPVLDRDEEGHEVRRGADRCEDDDLGAVFPRPIRGDGHEDGDDREPSEPGSDGPRIGAHDGWLLVRVPFGHRANRTRGSGTPADDHRIVLGSDVSVPERRSHGGHDASAAQPLGCAQPRRSVALITSQSALKPKRTDGRRHRGRHRPAEGVLPACHHGVGSVPLRLSTSPTMYVGEPFLSEPETLGVMR